jgi:hypothetical protein
VTRIENDIRERLDEFLTNPREPSAALKKLLAFDVPHDVK